jgi:hypothetical protein
MTTLSGILLIVAGVSMLVRAWLMTRELRGSTRPTPRPEIDLDVDLSDLTPDEPTPLSLRPAELARVEAIAHRYRQSRAEVVDPEEELPTVALDVTALRRGAP